MWPKLLLSFADEKKKQQKFSSTHFNRFNGSVSNIIDYTELVLSTHGYEAGVELKTKNGKYYVLCTPDRSVSYYLSTTLTNTTKPNSIIQLQLRPESDFLTFYHVKYY